ncbi:MAG: hypothetical protein HUU47_04830 [Bacteroidetes bacterium]|nr:hypothetical protein [Bacteroidota bacterium]
MLNFSCKTFAGAVKSFEPTKVLLSINIHNQPDSLGYNIVQDFPKFIYPKIMNGLINLWNNPDKEVKINGAALASIQNSSNTSFENVQNVFVHEIWELNNNFLDIAIIGFSFINKTQDGSVSYGFVDYEDLKPLLAKINIPCNSNGFVNITYEEVLKKMEFNFSIIQFGNDDFKNYPEKSLKIKKYLFENPKVKYLSDIKKNDKYKLIRFEIHNIDSPQNTILFSSISSFFKENMEQFYNLGADKDFNYLEKYPDLIFSKIKVTEIIKYNRENVNSKISSVQFFIEDKSLPVCTLDFINQMGIIVNFKPFAEFIVEKNYELILTQVNNENISENHTKEILNKIKNGEKILIKH